MRFVRLIFWPLVAAMLLGIFLTDKPVAIMLLFSFLVMSVTIYFIVLIFKCVAGLFRGLTQKS